MNNHLTEKAQRDFQLVRAALDKGDQFAYAELMKNYRDTLYFMMLKMTNNPQDADDLTIEAFGKAFRNLRKYTPEFAFSTWLFKIASNNCIDFMRKQKMGSTLSISQSTGTEESESIVEFLPASAPDPEETYIKEQKAQTLHEVVAKLKPHYRQLIEMRYFNELSYEEIAQEMNIPLGTVKAQLFRAREFLYHLLKNIHEKI